MKQFIVSLFLLFFTVILLAQNNTSSLIPMPNKITHTKQKKCFNLQPKIFYYSNFPDSIFAFSQLKNTFSKYFPFIKLEKSHNENNAQIVIKKDAYFTNPQAYKLEINKKGIIIQGCSEVAVLYGVITLDQLLLGDVINTKNNKISPIIIEDSPRYNYRALMLDPARNFLPVQDVKRYIHQMMKFKYNVLQLHLTDDQGWRVEIKSRPDLTKEGEYYTQEELKDLVKYAAERGIQIVPELDVPGHTVAVLASYPEFGCSHTYEIPKVLGKTTNMMLCSNNEQVYGLYKDVISEVAEIFPFEYIHLGGDESVIETNWAKCVKCKEKMEEKGYKQAKELMNYFFGRVLQYVKECDKKAILWCELDNIRMPANEYLFDYPKDVTLVTWRNGLTPKCIELSGRNGNNLIMAPGEYAYFDYPQYYNDFPEFDNWGMPITTLKKVYEFDPSYGLLYNQQSHIKGVMATLWGEAIKNINRAFYMTYPRGLAFAEAGWTNMENRNWESFKNRMYPIIIEMIKSGVNVRAPFEVAD